MKMNKEDYKLNDVLRALGIHEGTELHANCMSFVNDVINSINYLDDCVAVLDRKSRLVESLMDIPELQKQRKIEALEAELASLKGKSMPRGLITATTLGGNQ